MAHFISLDWIVFQTMPYDCCFNGANL